MSGLKQGKIWQPGLYLLTLFPAWGFAGQLAEDSSSLVLELRYCECAVINPDGSEAGVLPGFLAESTLRQAEVPEGGEGSLSADDISLAFEVGAVKDSPGRYRFTYSGSYEDGSGDSTSKGDLVLTRGQWVPLVQVEEHSAGDQATFGVAVRLVDAAGS